MPAPPSHGASWIDARRRAAAGYFLAVLVGRGQCQIDEMLPAFLTDRRYRRLCIEIVARPHLVCKPHAELRQPTIADIVGQHLAGQTHGQHSMREYTWVAGLLRH